MGRPLVCAHGCLLLQPAGMMLSTSIRPLPQPTASSLVVERVLF
jgi:hypothetical protein